MRSATIFWQSQSGNTFACVAAAAQALEQAGTTVFLHHLLAQDPLPLDTDLYLFAFPVYNFKPATTMRDFIARLPPEVAGKQALIIVSASALWSSTPYLARKMLQKKGVELCGAMLVKSSESYILLRKLLPFLRNHGLPDERQLQRVRDFVVKANPSNLKAKRYLANPCSLFYWLGAIAPDNAPGRPFAQRIWDQGKCTLCGSCHQLCPARAITRADNQLTCHEQKCLGCCGCFNLCPVNAWTTPAYQPKHFYKGPYAKAMLAALTTRSQTAPPQRERDLT